MNNPIAAWKGTLAGALLVIAALAAAPGAHAQAAGPGPAAAPQVHGPMAMRHPGGHGHGGEMMLFAGSPEQVARRVDDMLDGLNATDAQRAQVKQIAQAAAVDLKAQHESAKGLHERALQVFAAPTLDANAAEAARQELLAQHDQASRRVLAAMLDIGRVLSPEQRATLVKRIQERHAVTRDRMQRMQRDRAAAPKQP